MPASNKPMGTYQGRLKPNNTPIKARGFIKAMRRFLYTSEGSLKKTMNAAKMTIEMKLKKKLVGIFSINRLTDNDVNYL